VHRANPDLTSWTSWRRVESCPIRVFRAVRMANGPALREMWSGLTQTKSRVSGRVVGALVTRALGVATVGAFGGAGVAAFWAYVGRAGAGEAVVFGVVVPVGGVGGFMGCWAGQAWVGLVPLI
jgi:hypothetical protein